MRNVTSIVLMAILIVLPASLRAEAEEEKPTASAGIGVFSKYIWRGYELSKNSLVIQPSATVGYKGFSVNLWGNLDTNRDDRDTSTSDETRWTETDLTLEYGKKFGPVRLGVGYIYYALEGVDDSQEVYVSGSLDFPLTPTLTVYREVAHLPGWYFKLGVSHSVGLPKGMSLDLAGSVGYLLSEDDSFVRVDDRLNPTQEKCNDFHDGLISASLKVPLGKYMTLTPSVAYSFPLSSAADNLITSSSFSGDSDFVYGGVTLSLSF